MKKIKYFLMSSLLISIISFSCKKEKKTNSMILEYQVTPMNKDISDLQYRDTTGNVVDIVNPAENTSQFPANGSISFTVAPRGLNAFLSIATNPTSHDFNLKIWVGGAVKKDTTIQASNHQSGGKIVYLIQ